jgi:hypothetical protein
MIAITLGRIIWLFFGLLLMVGIWKIGLGLLKGMSSLLPPPPPSGEMRKIDVRYRCTVCGVEIRMTMAPDEDPPPPKHCMEEMVVMAPRFE